MNYEEANLSRASIVNDNDDWKPFRIEKCANCGKVPSISKHDNVINGNGRYTIRCCNQLIKGSTETDVIVKWNQLNTVNTGIDVTSGIGFADIGGEFSEDYEDGIIT